MHILICMNYFEIHAHCVVNEEDRRVKPEGSETNSEANHPSMS